jgi:hypothetical protein
MDRVPTGALQPGDRVQVTTWGYGVPLWACGFEGQVVALARRNVRVKLGHTGFDDPGRIISGRPEQFRVVERRRAERCPICGGPNPRDATHTRCM